ncbi:ABC transporter substrate-binding protein [Agromyces albus]|uniref:ABC transporter substrate-binding protein n=1 Tax=Agromyces albus TaxID=205332 RepID=UPI00278A3009|nr:ABC transporter substrate-binding protein [Agromyces albus]MDQ0573825.1 branched-chain amino acid transport system substrate-binding protein [Agromyces albus]
MTKTQRLAAIAAASVSILALAGCADGASGSGSDDSPIVFGVSGPLTGNQAEYGKNWQDGFELALEEINEDGGIDGRPVEIDFQDSQGEASQATTIAQRFVSDENILAVMGDFSSATSMVASPLYQRGRLLQLGITNSHPDFTTTGDFIFSPSVTQEVEGRFIENGAAKFGDKLAVFYLNTDWGNAAFDVFRDEAETNGHEIVYSTPVEEASTDFKPQLVQARDAGADAVVFYTYYSSTALLVQQAEQVGLTDVPFVAVGSNYSPEFLNLAGASADGVYTETSFYPETDDPAVDEFVAAFTEKFDTEPNLFAAFAYDGLKQLAWAAEQAETLDRTGIRDALRDGKDIPSIIYGDAEYNDERRIDDPKFTWLVVEDGAFVQTDDL